jgi:ABC-type cobalt transport system substrate-binding protein
MKSIKTQVIKRWFQKILRSKCVSPYECALVVFKGGIGAIIIGYSNKYLRINKASKDYQIL